MPFFSTITLADRRVYFRLRVVFGEKQESGRRTRIARDSRHAKQGEIRFSPCPSRPQSLARRVYWSRVWNVTYNTKPPNQAPDNIKSPISSRSYNACPRAPIYDIKSHLLVLVGAHQTDKRVKTHQSLFVVFTGNI